MPTTLDYQILVIGYHGCDAATARAVLLGEDEKSHIQIAVRDPNCILGYFRSRWQGAPLHPPA